MFAAEKILQALCTVILAAHPNLTEENCVMGIMSTTGFAKQLGLGESKSLTFQNILEAEQMGLITANQTAADACVFTILRTPLESHQAQTAFVVDSTQINLNPYASSPMLVQRSQPDCKYTYALSLPGGHLPGPTNTVTMGSPAPATTTSATTQPAPTSPTTVTIFN